ncbi:MAG: hypothetical protein ACYTG7_15890, partial [Planctomycetota bacterium]
MDADGGTCTIKIDGVSIAVDEAGIITSATDVYHHISETFTANKTGMVELEILHERADAYDENVEHYVDNICVCPENAEMEALNHELPAPAGGVFDFQIDAGAQYANKMFIILQSFTGCDPGFNMNGGQVHVPLIADWWTYLALSLNPYWCNFYGMLDHSGRATANMNTFGPQPAAQGGAIYLAALVLEDSGFIP